MSRVELPVLTPRFAGFDRFRERCGTSYQLLPFRFIRLDDHRYVVTNFVGEFLVVERDVLEQLIHHRLPMHSGVYEDLKSRHFLLDGDSTVALDLLAVKYRTKQSLLPQLTSLFMFVVTLRCDHSCPYCQVSRRSTDRHAYDMTEESARRAVDCMFQSPAAVIKVEFQGGEPLLNFDLVRKIVTLVEERNATEGRNIAFVIATTLAFVTEEILDFCAEHGVAISTSLDGPASVHDSNRPRPERDSHKRAIEGIERARTRLGHENVSALMTTTHNSLGHEREIVDEYVRLGFDAIFLRPLSPFGFAVKSGMVKKYSTAEWLTFYRSSLDYILQLNRNGVAMREEYTALLLRKLLTPYPTGYVDLQSPAGIGISALVFNYDGGIYASDESRMLAEMGDNSFRLGDLATDSFQSVITSDRLIGILRQSLAESSPMCSDCGFLPYCGSDPVYHYATQGDVVGLKPASGFCERSMAILRDLILRLEDRPEEARFLRGWVGPGAL